LDIELLCPIQFIEGRNKFAEPDKPSTIEPDAYIEYIPKICCSITGITMFVTWPKITESQVNKLTIYADYLDHPTDIVITEGKMTFEEGEEPSENWREIEIVQPVVLIAHKRYWLQFSDLKTELAFYAGSKGDQILTRTKSDKGWKTKSDFLMLRVYGRVLPVAFLH
jgi:hypothetical protein